MKLLFLYGPPAVGKLTVATELAALTGLPLFHNHVSFDLAAAFFPFGSRGFQQITDTVRMTVFEVAAREGLDGLIFTFVYGSPIDDPWVETVISTVERHGGEVCFTRLHCAREVLEERVTAEGRRRFRKLTDPAQLRRLLEDHDVFAPVPFRESLAIDTSQVTPREAARQIAAHFGLPEAGTGGG